MLKQSKRKSAFFRLIFLSLFVVPSLANARPKLVTSFTVIADIARNVAGDAAEVESITKAGAEIHDYQPTPKDIIRAQGATAILWNGLKLERWFERFLRDAKGIPNFIVSEGVEPLSIYEGPYSGKPNPHAWMSTRNALIYVENIRKALVKIDPANEAAYTANAAAYTAKFQAIEGSVKTKLARVPEGQRWLVTSEGAFPYLARSLGLKELFLWAVNSDQQGTPQQVQKVIDGARANKIPVVFSESTVSDKPMRQVAKETGARYGGVLYVDSLSDAKGPVPSYLRLLEYDVETIVKGLLGE